MMVKQNHHFKRDMSKFMSSTAASKALDYDRSSIGPMIRLTEANVDEDAS